jgi:hypothetical protein
MATCRLTPHPIHLHWHAGASVSRVQWSPAQKAHRRFWRECVANAKLAVRDPELRQFYLEMAKKSKRSKGRPFDMEVSDYHNGNDMLWIKLYGDREKPEGWSWESSPTPGT